MGAIGAAAGIAGGQTSAGAVGALPNFGLSSANAASATMTAAASAAAGSDAPVPVAGLAVAIAARSQGGTNQFDIRLDPPELGRIEVRLGVDGNGQVTSHVTADRPDTLQLLQSQQPQLERALEQAGLKTAENGMQFSLRDQSFASQQNNGGAPQQNTAQQLVIPDSDMTPIDTTQIYSRLSRGTGVDIRV
jgi:chemotaxis protein MotD